MNVKLVKFASGQEVVCELVSEDSSSITIKNCLSVVPTASGSIGMIPFILLVDRGEDEVTIDKMHILFTITPNDSVVTQHTNNFSAIVQPQSKSLIL